MQHLNLIKKRENKFFKISFEIKIYLYLKINVFVFKNKYVYIRKNVPKSPH